MVALRRMGSPRSTIWPPWTPPTVFLDTYHREVSPPRPRPCPVPAHRRGRAGRHDPRRHCHPAHRLNPVPAAISKLTATSNGAQTGPGLSVGRRWRCGDESTAVFVPSRRLVGADAAAERAWRTVRRLGARAPRPGSDGWKRVRVYHRSPAEASRLHRILGGGADLLDPTPVCSPIWNRCSTPTSCPSTAAASKVVAPLFRVQLERSRRRRRVSSPTWTRCVSGRRRPAVTDWLLAYNADDTAALARSATQ